MPHTSSPRARLVRIARTRFPKPSRRNVAPVAVAAGKTNAAVVDNCAAELVVVDLHQRAAVVLNVPSTCLSYLLKKTICTNLPYATCLTVSSTASAFTSFFAREGSVRLPQHLKYIDRSSSPIRPLSLLCRPCSLLLLHGFRRCCTERLASLPHDIVFLGSGRVTRR